MNSMADFLAHLSANHDHVLYLISGISFIIELSIMGLSGPLLFFAISCALTGLMVSFGIIDSWQIEVLLVGVLTGVCALILWKPLKKFQNSGHQKDHTSDLIGKSLIAVEEITLTQGAVRYSGINWPARLATDITQGSISKGSMCKVISVNGNVLIVEPRD